MHEPTITFSGNLAAKPKLKPIEGPNGPTVVASMRVAVTPRRRSRDADEWVDGETMWFDVSAWRTTAGNAVSLNQGDKVVVTGRLTQRTWTDSSGVDHPGFAVDAESIGLDIARYPATSLRPAPEQRAEAASQQTPTDPEHAAGTDWVSTGQVDPDTGEVRMQPADPQRVEEPATV
ncbi:MAG: single-stranded DNA-binding protein [Actinomycetes bacterium]